MSGAHRNGQAEDLFADRKRAGQLAELHCTLETFRRFAP
jgi:hypothetical protein